MADNMDFEQAQILFNAQLVSVQVKVKALKKLLSSEQLDVFNQSVQKDKEVFLDNNSNATEETKRKIDIAFHN